MINNPFEENIKREFGESLAIEKYEWLTRLFPEFNTRLAKFSFGVYRWHRFGQIDLDSLDDVGHVRMILKVIDSTPWFDFFDHGFNDVSPEMVCEIIGISPDATRKESPFVANYCVLPIKCYEQAYAYREAVGWCIVASEESFNAYAASGSRFYFCANHNWFDVPCQIGENYPLDNYGLSLLAVELDAGNRIRSITTRWNDTGNNLNESRFRRLLGDKFEILGVAND